MIHSCRTYSSDLIEHPLNIIIHRTNYFNWRTARLSHCNLSR